MLNNAYIHQIHEITEKQEQEIKQLIQNITNDIKYNLKKMLVALSQNKKTHI